jgi:hypothetical protein
MYHSRKHALKNTLDLFKKRKNIVERAATHPLTVGS